MKRITVIHNVRQQQWHCRLHHGPPKCVSAALFTETVPRGS
jgi:hypothetical protein